jgi:hypothetical protein
MQRHLSPIKMQPGYRGQQGELGEDRDFQIANYAQDFVSKIQSEPVASVETLKLLCW